MNSSPIANDDSVLTDEFSVTVDVLANDIDLDDDELIITDAVVSSGTGEVEFTNTDITFTPNGSGEAMITYTIIDSFGHYATAVLTVNVSPTGGLNTPPIANHDLALTTVNQPVTVDVLANDVDADGDTLIITSIEMDANLGTVDVNENYSITFSPAAGFFGDAIISYHITDSASASVAATLLVAVGGEMDGDEFNNTLTGSSADDILNGMEGNDKLLGNHGDDWLDGGEGNDSLTGGQGDDQLDGGEGDDVLTGSAGNDLLMGNDGSDEYIFGLGDGQDTIDNLDYDDVVNVDRLVLRVGITPSMIELKGEPDNIDDLVITMKGTTDSITIQDYFTDQSYQLDAIEFADGTVWSKETLSHLPLFIRGENDSDDVLYGLERHEYIEGLSGDDELDGNDGDDTLIGGLGNDLLMGSNGNDSYLFNLGDGQDSIYNIDMNEYFNGLNSIDRLILGLGIDPSMIELHADSDSADNLVIMIKGTSDSLTLQDYFVEESFKLDEIVFSNGTVWNKATLAAMMVMNTGDDDDNELTGTPQNDVIHGLAGDDILMSHDGNDTLMGGVGDDSLDGGNGNDTYIFNLNDGQDTLNNVDESEYYEGINSVDTLVFGLGIDASMIELQGDSDNTDNLILAIKGTSDRVLLQDYFSDESYQLDIIKFADGAIWDKTHLSHIQLTIRGEEGSDDMLLGSERGEIIEGLSGDDYLDGDDGNDTLIGGLGDDVVAGGAGNDSYLFNLGDGQDSIDNYDDNEYVNDINSMDRLIFGSGIDASTIELRTDTGNADNLVIALLNSNDTITILNYFVDDSYMLDELMFADGTILTKNDLAAMPVITDGGAEGDYLEGTNNKDLIVGGQGDDFIDGVGGDDYLVGGHGDDFLDGGDGNDELLGGDGDDFLEGGDGNDSLYGDIGDVANIGDDTLFGGDGNDSVFAGEGDDTLIGGAGDDYLRGEGGNDTYVFNRGDGQDVIVNYDMNKDSSITETLIFGEGISSADIVFSKDKININDLVIGIKGTGDRIIINQYFADAHQLSFITFANGTIWDEAQITQRIDSKKIEGTAGGDTLQGGSGDDTYIVNDVHDVVLESTNAGIDTVESSLSYILRDNLENLTLIGNTHISATGNTADNLLKGNEGDNRLLGGAGNDTLYGLAGGDTLNGGEGTDTMYGSLGNDTFTVENVGDIVNESMNEGFDTVNSFISYTLTANVERLMLEGLDNLNGFGNDLDNTLNGNNANNSLVGGLGNDTLQGKGGADTLEGGLGNDLYYVDNVGDIVTELANEGTDKVSSSISYTLTANVEQLFLTGIAGLEGAGNNQNNIIYGNSGNNQLFGDVGNDSLNGGAGNDLLDGGLGLDTLVGGAGNDTYVLGINSNRDLINNNDATGNDKLLFDTGINTDQVWLRQLGNDLEVSIMGTANSVNVQNWYSNTANQLDSLQLADGKTLLANEVQTLVEAMAAFAVPALGQTSLTTAQHAVLDSVIVASW